MKHLVIVSQRLKEYNTQINMKKSEFLQESVIYCGYKVGFAVRIDESEIEVMKTWPAPTNSSAVRSFLGLGLLGYYKFIKNFRQLLYIRFQGLHLNGNGLL